MSFAILSTSTPRHQRGDEVATSRWRAPGLRGAGRCAGAAAAGCTDGRRGRCGSAHRRDRLLDPPPRALYFLGIGNVLREDVRCRAHLDRPPEGALLRHLETVATSAMSGPVRPSCASMVRSPSGLRAAAVLLLPASQPPPCSSLPLMIAPRRKRALRRRAPACRPSSSGFRHPGVVDRTGGTGRADQRGGRRRHILAHHV